MVVASWALATVITGLVVWRAVAVLDDGTRTDVLSAAQVSGLLTSASATPGTTSASASSVTIPAAASPATSVPTAPATSPASTRTATTATTTTKPPAPTPTPVARTWTVTGGVASAACTGQVISLLSASPADGWRVKIESRGPDRVKLEFTSGGREVKLTATCVGGMPSQTTTEDD